MYNNYYNIIIFLALHESMYVDTVMCTTMHSCMICVGCSQLCAEVIFPFKETPMAYSPIISDGNNNNNRN